MKTYTFTNDSYWFSNGCDCCEDLLMESYNCDETSCNLGSANCEDDCYLQSIATEIGCEYWEDIPIEYREMDFEDLKLVAEILNITVEFIE